jgi:diadenosine tetraphosphatase ApaH/serine/threonine PP2A family protein phosphatase
MSEPKNVISETEKNEVEVGKSIAPPSLKRLSASEIISLCNSVQEILSKEPNVVSIRSPLIIVGDLHGQYFDLLELLEIGGDNISYLFLGDFVDRGSFSIETLTLLLTLKLKHPNRITLLRGNHESRQVTQVYGFYDEIMRKYGSADVWIRCTTLFDYLPLAGAVTDSKAFAVHAGLSPLLEHIDDLQEVERVRDVTSEGVICDLLWSDPADDESQSGWSVSQRGAGYVFGRDIVQEFNRQNNIDLIIRSHQLVMQGYNEMFEGCLTTVWSAPNYMNRCGNDAAILKLGEDTEISRIYLVFSASSNASAKAEELPDYFL